jgi:hypothetical protein
LERLQCFGIIFLSLSNSHGRWYTRTAVLVYQITNYSHLSCVWPGSTDPYHADWELQQKYKLPVQKDLMPRYSTALVLEIGTQTRVKMNRVETEKLSSLISSGVLQFQ